MEIMLQLKKTSPSPVMIYTTKIDEWWEKKRKSGSHRRLDAPEAVTSGYFTSQLVDLTLWKFHCYKNKDPQKKL